jgi:ketosteroid isomerase-like protein
MSRENLEIVRDQYAATNRRDFHRAMSHYAENVELVTTPPCSCSRSIARAEGRAASGSKKP